MKPNFSAIKMGTVLETLGQAFFSVGIELAATYTYGSYLDKKDSNLVTDGMWVVSLDTFIAVISILSQGPWAHIKLKLLGMGRFKLIGYLSGNILLILGGLLHFTLCCLR